MFTLHNGDALEYMKSLQDKAFDVSFTSPPYNRKRNDKYSNYTDQVEDYYGWMCDVIDELLRLTKRHVFFNIQPNYYNRQDVNRLFGRYYDRIVENIIWEKDNPMPAGGYNITNAVEYFIIFGNEPLRSNRTYTKNIVHSPVNSKMPKNHKAVMHQAVADYFHATFMQKGDKVFDCFTGLGTTGKSCVRYGMEFTGCELDEEYYGIAKREIEGEISLRLLTPLALDGGDSAIQQALFTPEILSTLQGESTPAPRQ